MKLLKFYASWCGPCKGLSMVINGAKDKISIPIEEIDIDTIKDFEFAEIVAKSIISGLLTGYNFPSQT